MRRREGGSAVLVATGLVVAVLVGAVVLLLVGRSPADRELADARSEIAVMTTEMAEIRRELSDTEEELDDATLETQAAMREVRSLEHELRRLEVAERSAPARGTDDVVAPIEEEDIASPAPPVYIAPDSATVRQMMRATFRERLERDPYEDELRVEVDW